MNHEKMMQIFYEIYGTPLPRLAPGDGESTRRALQMLYGADLRSLDEEFRVLDIGCGTGAQTLHLAAELGGRVTAVDNHQPYLDELARRAAAQGLTDRIEIHCSDMNGLDLGDEKFDLVWAEGSAYILGIPEALRAWRSYLKPGGAIGFTELTWLKDGAPDECREYFAAEYPAMNRVGSHLATIEACDYELVGWFSLPETSWWEPYYRPLSARVAGYESRDDDETQAVVNMARREIEIYRNFSRWYGYVFFVLRMRS
jgi:ubiquinone/menaquinone biosynthesis C-methylase UbiE